MPLLTIILVLIAVGVLLYVVNRLLPMDARIKLLLNIVAFGFVLIWLLKALGAWHWLASVKI